MTRFVLALCLLFSFASIAVADPIAIEPMHDAGALDAGSASAPVVAEAPSASLSNPVDDPLGAFDDARSAKKQGWAIFVLACIVMTTAGLARAGTKWGDSKFLAWFVKNKTLVYVVSSLGAVSAAAFDALALGGTWGAAGFAGVGAFLTLVMPRAKA